MWGGRSVVVEGPCGEGDVAQSVNWFVRDFIAGEA